MEQQLVSANGVALRNAIDLWADATTDSTSSRRNDLLRDKRRAILGFFDFVQKHPAAVTPMDVATWQANLESRGLSHSTVYGNISKLSSFYEWALHDPSLRQIIVANPVDLSRPKAPRAYQSESTKSLDDEDAVALLSIVKTKADSGDVTSKRDFALLLLFLETGMRRAEVIGLKWADIKINGGLTIACKVKGGDYRSRRVEHPSCKAALLDYLEASGRLSSMVPESPLWVRHDRAGAGEAITSHGVAKNLKAYAQAAGIGEIHLHQLRHTFGRWVAEDAGSMTEVQDAMGHKSLATTRVYVARVSTKCDKFSSRIAERLGL